MEFSFEQIYHGEAVVREDGLKGRVTAVETTAEPPYIYVEYADGTAESLTEADFKKIYRIGNNIFGNRISGAIIDEQIRQIAQELAPMWQAIKDKKAEYLAVKRPYWVMKEELNASGLKRFEDSEKQAEYSKLRDDFFRLKSEIDALYERKDYLKKRSADLRKQLYRLNHLMNGGDYTEQDDNETEQTEQQGGESND